MCTKATVVEVIIPVATKKTVKIELKGQQPWTAVSALLGLISMVPVAVSSRPVAHKALTDFLHYFSLLAAAILASSHDLHPI